MGSKHEATKAVPLFNENSVESGASLVCILSVKEAEPENSTTVNAAADDHTGNAVPMSHYPLASSMTTRPVPVQDSSPDSALPLT